MPKVTQLIRNRAEKWLQIDLVLNITCCAHHKENECDLALVIM